jgi:phosphoserine phosphatase
VGTPQLVAIVDFDGTLVTVDYLDELCAMVGKRAASEELHAKWLSGEIPGPEALVERVNLLSGLPLSVIAALAELPVPVMPGATELFECFARNDIFTVIASGDITPVLEAFGGLFGADLVLGTRPAVADGKLARTAKEDVPQPGFKLVWAEAILAERGASWADTVTIGDGPGELDIFARAGLAIAVNPIGGLDRVADLVLAAHQIDCLTTFL